MKTFFAAALVAAALAWPVAAATDPNRGRALYELRCTSCHSESVHGRVKRAAADFDAVRGWVARWNRDLGIGWSASEIDDVAVWLNMTYYRYPCPAPACRVAS